MNFSRLFIIAVIISAASSASGQVYLEEGFELGIRPDNWTEITESGNQQWRYRNGGHNPNDINWTIAPELEDISRNPPSAHSGTYNAILFNESNINKRTKLVTPPLDLEGGTAIQLSFYLCQVPWTFAGSTTWDNTRIYYKNSEEGDWILLEEYLDPIYSWELKKLFLPDLSSTYYIAFEGHIRWGFGACIDDIIVEESGSEDLYLNDYSFIQPFNNFVPSGMTDVALMRSDLKVFGNAGTLNLEQMEFTSECDSDLDLVPGSLKLYYTKTQIFDTETPIGTASDIVAGKVNFTNIGHSFIRGTSYIWLAGDIASDAQHGNIIDFSLASGSITIGGEAYPAESAHPVGNRIVSETVYHTDFENETAWNVMGEWEIGIPTGEGGSAGNPTPNPPEAYQGNNVLGTDLSGLGANPFNYEPGLTHETSYIAESPLIQGLYYQNLKIFYQRYINIDVWDKAYLELSTDGGNTWNTAWSSSSFLGDFQWTEALIDVPSQVAKSDSLKIRFKLGPTDGIYNYSGWHVDNLFMTGEYIHKDVGIKDWITPVSGSGHTSQDTVKVIVKNYGGSDIDATVPIAFSLNGGASWRFNNAPMNIPVGEEITYTFSVTADLSAPGLYPNVLAKTFLPGDQDQSNDQFSTSIYVRPTFTIPYAEGFETDDGYWIPENSIWEYGTPAGSVINSAASGSKSWVTDLDATYSTGMTTIDQSIFEDDFELENGWTFEGEFEWAKPSRDGIPFFSNHGFKCIGTDISGTIVTGSHPLQYENNITPGTAYTATSPTIDVSQYSKLVLSIARWIDVIEGDSVKIQVSPDDGTTWHTIWRNTEGGIADGDYQYYFYDIPEHLVQTSTFRIRFALTHSSLSGPVGAGFNIDDLILSGDYVSKAPLELVSPLLDFTGTENPLFEAMIWTDTEPDTDGATFYYSLDEGDSWNPITNSSGKDAFWNWYTGNPVSALGPGIDGWSGQTDGWLKVRHTLPLDIAGEPKVQLKLKFQSDKSYNEYDGFAIDDIKITDAPYDLSILDITYPITSCVLTENEHFSIQVKNDGVINLKAGSSINIGYLITKDGQQQSVQESYVFDSDLNSGQSSIISLNTGFDFSAIGEYEATVFLMEEDPFFYGGVSNDTITEFFQVNRPLIDLGPDISTAQADTVILYALPDEPGNTYKWQDNSGNSSFDVAVPGTYWVDVTNTSACTSRDSIDVLELIINTAVSELYGLTSACEHSDSEQIEILIENVGTDTIAAGDTIFASAAINDLVVTRDTIKLGSRFFPGNSFRHTFSDNYDFSVPGSYNLDLSAIVRNDNINENDTLSFPLLTHGYPDVDLGPDTTVNAVHYLLAPTPGYAEYLWQDGSTEESFDITYTGSGRYFVTVKDEYLCTSRDTVEVTLNAIDVSLDALLSPSSGCEETSSITVAVRIKNNGSNPLSAGETVKMGYMMDGGTPVVENLVLATDIQSSSTLDYIFSKSENVSNGNRYDFVVYIEYPGDGKLSNDTIYQSIGIFAPPVVDLGPPYQTIAAFSHTLDAGAGHTSYLWQDGSTDQTFEISEPGLATYSVLVSNINGCQTYEEVQIELVVPDIGIETLISPGSACSLGSSEKIKVSLKNYGKGSISDTADIFVSYSVNNSPAVTEKVNLSAPMLTSTSLSYTFNEAFDFSGVNTYEIVVYTTYELDLVPDNDIAFASVEVYGAPSVDIGPDTIITKVPVTLSAETGFESYLWEDGSTLTDHTIDEYSAEIHWVEVSAPNGCTARDSAYVVYDLPDLAIVELISPVSDCSTSPNTIVKVEITNEGFVTLPVGEKMTMTYSVNGGTSKIDQVSLQEELPPGENTIISYKDPFDFSLAGSYSVYISLIYGPDSDFSDNTQLFDVLLTQSPTVDLVPGNDTLKTELPVTLDAGSGYPFYTWQDNSTGSTFEVTEYGWYYVVVAGPNGCTTKDSAFVMTPVSIENWESAGGSINIYPNPAKELLNITLETDIAFEASIELRDILNKLVYKEEFRHPGYSEFQIDIQHLAPGAYYIHMIAGETASVYMVIVL